MSGTKHKSTFDGRCVTTMVLMSPMRAAMRAASSAEKPARRFAPKNNPPRAAISMSKRVWNHNASRLCTMKPPAKASRANSDASRVTAPRERWSPSTRRTPDFTAVASMERERRANKTNSTSPHTAYAHNRTRYDSSSDIPERCNAAATEPPTSAPVAVANEPTST